MFFKTALFLFGYGLTIIGLIYIISYLNFLTIGYNFNFYVNFIIRRIECWYSIIGIIIMLTIILKGEKNELYI